MKPNWEMIARKMAALAVYGYGMEHFDKYFDDPTFLTEDWLFSYYGRENVEPYVLDDLNAIDLLIDHHNSSPFAEPAIEEIP